MDHETSPTNSSLSSSDLDTESTGSFFIDQSRTLGSLMGLTFSELPARPGRPPLGRQPVGGAGDDSGVRKQKVRRTHHRRRRSVWWQLCCGEVGPTSLEEFLRAERRIAVAEADFIYGSEEYEAFRSGTRLFENGRVLAPVAAAASSSAASSSASTSSAAEGRRRRGREAPGGAMGRLPVLIAGICSGGEG